MADHPITCAIADMADCPENDFDFGHKTLFGDGAFCYHCNAVCTCGAVCGEDTSND